LAPSIKELLKGQKMRVTRRQLRRIIKEELETLSYDAKTISAEEAESAELAKEKAEDIVPVEDAWDGGANLVHPVDFEALSVDDKVVHGQEVMKVTESQLRRIIMESYMKERYGQIEEIIYSVLEVAPGIAGMDLVDELQSIWAVEALNSDAPPVDRDEIFSILDNLQEENEVFFDVEEDAWYMAEDQPREADDKEWDIL
jgi:hypothetical protein